ncbi:MAG: DoxX family protein [bacterium]
MDRQKLKNRSAWVLSTLLTLVFTVAALTKLASAQGWITRFTKYGYPKWLLFVVGALELLGGILLLVPRVSIYGASVLGIIMIGAACTHLANGEGLQVLRPVIVMMFLGIVVWLRGTAKR